MAPPILDLLDKVLPETPECPDPLAIDKLREAADTFCRQTRACQRDIAVTYEPSQVACLVTPPEGLQIHAVLTVSTPEGPLQPAGHLPPSTVPGTPRRFAIASPPALLVLEPLPREPINLTVRAVVTPDFAADALPDELGQWRDAIAHGAKALLLAMPDKPWTSPETALYYHRLFYRAIDEVRAAANRGFAPVGLRVQLRPFV